MLYTVEAVNKNGTLFSSSHYLCKNFKQTLEHFNEVFAKKGFEIVKSDLRKVKEKRGSTKYFLKQNKKYKAKENIRQLRKLQNLWILEIDTSIVDEEESLRYAINFARKKYSKEKGEFYAEFLEKNFLNLLYSSSNTPFFYKYFLSRLDIDYLIVISKDDFERLFIPDFSEEEKEQIPNNILYANKDKTMFIIKRYWKTQAEKEIEEMEKQRKRFREFLSVFSNDKDFMSRFF